MKSDFKLMAVLLLLLAIASAARREFAAPPGRPQPVRKSIENSEPSVAYINKEYGFRLDLPRDWKGFTIISEQWKGRALDHSGQDQTGPQIRIRNPKYTAAEPYEDIPIMVFTRQQWQQVRKETLGVSAAPIPPAAVAHNSNYVFATPPRFYYDFAKGYEEVLRILANRPIRTFTPAVRSPHATQPNP